MFFVALNFLSKCNQFIVSDIFTMVNRMTVEHWGKYLKQQFYLSIWNNDFTTSSLFLQNLFETIISDFSYYENVYSWFFKDDHRKTLFQIHSTLVCSTSFLLFLVLSAYSFPYLSTASLSLIDQIIFSDIFTMVNRMRKISDQ